YVPREVSVQGRDVVIVDDIISTGGTIAEASRTLLRSGARSVLVAATHGLLVGDAVNRISSAGVKRIVLGDTLLTRYFHPLVEYVDISSRVSRTLRGVLGLP
ncbi:MAG: phosphoribosyltransferase family protein, partial [Desulfurococcaceae archaeon]